jgi:hypothetical protein
MAFEKFDAYQFANDNLTGEKDKFGVIAGTKSSEVLKMFERGAAMREVKKTIEGNDTYYNLLGKMVTAGHKVEKLAGGVWKLTHKNELMKAPAKKPVAKKEVP